MRHSAPMSYAILIIITAKHCVLEKHNLAYAIQPELRLTNTVFDFYQHLSISNIQIIESLCLDKQNKFLDPNGQYRLEQDSSNWLKSGYDRACPDWLFRSETKQLVLLAIVLLRNSWGYTNISDKCNIFTCILLNGHCCILIRFCRNLFLRIQ